MLNFLDQDRHQKAARTSLKFKPQMVYGHTRQSSPHMLGNHTVYYQSESSKLPQLTKILTSKDPSPKEEELKVPIQKKQQGQEFNRFNITRGEFTAFVDRHKHYKSIGELHKESPERKKIPNLMANWNNSTNVKSQFNRSESAIKKLTLLSDWKKSSNASLPNSSINFTRSSSLSIISSTFDKSKIRSRREEFNVNAHHQMDRRRKTQNGCFRLPRQGPDHELYFVNKPKIPPIVPLSETEELNQDIALFEKKMLLKLK